MSTLWYESRCAEVHSVEDQYEWYRRVEGAARRATVYYLRGRPYVGKIRDFPDGHFDVISIDGGARLACLEAALENGCAPMMMLDDTDSPDLEVAVSRVSGLSAWETHRFTGFAPGQFFVQETTILRRVQPRLDDPAHSTLAAAPIRDGRRPAAEQRISLIA